MKLKDRRTVKFIQLPEVLRLLKAITRLSVYRWTFPVVGSERPGTVERCTGGRAALRKRYFGELSLGDAQALRDASPQDHKK